uniref:NAD(+) ADP-ribosyltransferase n=1 Tax=Bracon brevicornis TaxID=1563983 RepID=A0A6V7J6B8_9HYME
MPGDQPEPTSSPDSSRKRESLSEDETVTTDHLSPAKKLKSGSLEGMKFVILGRTKREKKVLKEEIMKLGGKVGTRVNAFVAAVIASKTTLERESDAIYSARLHKIQVVPEDFVDEVRRGEEAPIALIKKMNIASWGDDPQPRIDGSILKILSGSLGKVTVVLADEAVVEPESGMETSACVHEEDDVKYSATLVQTDAESQEKSFFKMQLLRHKAHDFYWLFKMWGKLGGTEYEQKLVKYGNQKDGAVDEFLKIFLKKTGNSWSDKGRFVEKPGLMRLMTKVDEDEQREQL